MPLTEAEEREYLRLLETDERFEARASHQAFMEYTWTHPNRPFITAFHTRMICTRIDKAFEDFREGKSTYLLISVPYRHGKTDITSRWLGPHFLGEFPDQEVMQVSYKAELAEDFAATARDIVRSPKYRRLYPKVILSKETNQKSKWVLVDASGAPTGGRLFASGFRGVTGSGGALIIVDDYLSGRQEAESLVARDNVWNSIRDDVLTRKAPVHIVVILATQWHVDDPNGRIQKAMKEDPEFPRFEILRFPARASKYKGPGKYPSEYLFEERYSKKWYREQYATLGPYSSAALLDCDPQMRTGAILSTDGIIYVDTVPGELDLKWARVWDLAHTKKQRKSDDPDWTRGTRLAFEMKPGDPVPHLWISHSVRVREGAVLRDKKIKETAHMDGRFTKQAIEISSDSRDAYDYLKEAVKDYAWHKVEIAGKGDKVVRATPLEPIFAAKGHVHLKRGEWNADWLDEVMNFDGSGGFHDEAIDNMTAGYLMLGPSSSVRMSDTTRSKLAARRG
jgi:phage terminase large subunit-like protein